jgi:hypothetical protein
MDVVWLKKDARLADHGPLASVLLGGAARARSHRRSAPPLIH